MPFLSGVQTGALLLPLPPMPFLSGVQTGALLLPLPPIIAVETLKVKCSPAELIETLNDESIGYKTAPASGGGGRVKKKTRGRGGTKQKPP
jgi:hypothetical protein